MYSNNTNDDIAEAVKQYRDLICKSKKILQSVKLIESRKGSNKLLVTITLLPRKMSGNLLKKRLTFEQIAESIAVKKSIY